MYRLLISFGSLAMSSWALGQSGPCQSFQLPLMLLPASLSCHTLSTFFPSPVIWLIWRCISYSLDVSLSLNTANLCYYGIEKYRFCFDLLIHFNLCQGCNKKDRESCVHRNGGCSMSIWIIAEASVKVGVLKNNDSSLFGIQVAFLNNDCGIIAYVNNTVMKQDPIWEHKHCKF